MLTQAVGASQPSRAQVEAVRCCRGAADGRETGHDAKGSDESPKHSLEIPREGCSSPSKPLLLGECCMQGTLRRCISSPALPSELLLIVLGLTWHDGTQAGADLVLYAAAILVKDGL